MWLEPRIRFTAGRERQLGAELERIRKFIGPARGTFDDGYLKTDW